MNFENDKSIYAVIKEVHSELLEEFDINKVRKLKELIVKSKSDDCFDEFVNIFLDFKHEKEFLNALLECKETFFLRFFKYLSILEIDKTDWNLFIRDYK